MIKYIIACIKKKKAEKCKKALVKSYIDYVIGKMIWEGEKNPDGVYGLLTDITQPEESST
jgi:hypothetical protein